jgi:actin-like ATPase involved in cell morphogenesis
VDAHLRAWLEQEWREGKRGKALWDAIGKRVAEEIKTSIGATVYPPLAPKTIEIKGRKGVPHPSKIWVETGETYDAVTWDVRPLDELHGKP